MRTESKGAFRVAKGVTAVGGVQALVPASRLAVKAARRRAHRRAKGLADWTRSVADTLAKVPGAAQELGLIESPKPKRTTPRVAAGVVIGATAVYFLEPGPGGERRRNLARLVG